ncbi:MAG: tyrosine-type recombinase/integrase [Halomonas sp.]|uniref:tyrosine-type recombinase/integrase n=1 Tax=Halomonas sp. TaxID=1486246 RepID=UPI002ACDC5AE|nr:tyrosine-type recombinase/integrase [Halomonas sp.]MDZ7852946.1 tyrosine-type recombinase/integrase [Halomonas sp.]
MPKRAKELTAIEVKRLTEPGFHAVGGVAGLHLTVKTPEARSWILRARVGSLRRDIGLGGYPDVSLAMAREYAREAKARIKAGVDPVAERKAMRSELLAQQVKEITFEQAAAKVIAKKQAEASNPKHAAQWASTLKTYAYPVLGKMAVKDIEISHVIKMLEPEWEKKTETMTRVRQRVEAVLAWATVNGHRSGDNPARWKGNLDAVLPAPAKVGKKQNHAALPYTRVGEFMSDLRTRDGMAAKALEFAVLTAARSGEIRGARWDEIDLAEKVWIVPAGRMKAKREHRVPLSDAAVDLLQSLPRIDDSELIFPAPRGGQMSDATLAAVIKRINSGKPEGEAYVDPKQDHRAITQHGFRSTFRDWAAEHTGYANEVVEMALAHTIKNQAEAAYRRGDMLDKRHRLMSDWADFLNDAEPQAGAVTPIRKEAK